MGTEVDRKVGREVGREVSREVGTYVVLHSPPSHLGAELGG